MIPGHPYAGVLGHFRIARAQLLDVQPCSAGQPVALELQHHLAVADHGRPWQTGRQTPGKSGNLPWKNIGKVMKSLGKWWKMMMIQNDPWWSRMLSSRVLWKFKCRIFGQNHAQLRYAMLCLDTLGYVWICLGHVNVGWDWIPIEKMGSTAATSWPVVVLQNCLPWQRATACRQTMQ